MAGESKRFQVHITSPGRRGSKLFTLAFGGLIVSVGVGGYWFYTNTPGQIEHVRSRDRLATISAQVLTARGVPPEAEAPLLEALEHGEPALRAAAARALGSLQKEEHVALLGGRTTDSSPIVRVAAIEALERNGNGMLAGRWLEPALGDPVDIVKVAACRAVAALGLRHLHPGLIGLLAHNDRKVNNAAREALEKLSGTTYGMDQIRWGEHFSQGR